MNTLAELYREWEAQYDANAAQAQRLSDEAAQEAYASGDTWAPLLNIFTPGEAEPLGLPLVTPLLRPEDTLLDVGAGGGRIAAALAGTVEQIRGVDPSPALSAALHRLAAELPNLEALDAFAWPPADFIGQSDVVLSWNVLYYVREIEQFLDAYEAHGGRLCIAVLGERAGAAPPQSLFEAVRGEPFAELPALNELIAILAARGADYELRRTPRPPVVEVPQVERLRRLCMVTEGSPEDTILQAELERRADDDPKHLNSMRTLAVVSWVPPEVAS